MIRDNPLLLNNLDDKLIVGKLHPNVTFECSHIISNLDAASIQDLLKPIKTKFKESYNGITTKNFLYNFTTKL